MPVWGYIVLIVLHENHAQVLFDLAATNFGIYFSWLLGTCPNITLAVERHIKSFDLAFSLFYK